MSGITLEWFCPYQTTTFQDSQYKQMTFKTYSHHVLVELDQLEPNTSFNFGQNNMFKNSQGSKLNRECPFSF